MKYGPQIAEGNNDKRAREWYLATTPSRSSLVENKRDTLQWYKGYIVTNLQSCGVLLRHLRLPRDDHRVPTMWYLLSLQ